MPSPADAGTSAPRLLTALALLWLGGAGMRFTILGVPPVVPLIHDDLHLSEAQVGLLIGLPLVLFALASVPGSLLVARLGAVRTLILGLLVTAIAAAARGAAPNIWLLYAATALMGVGVSVMQPAVPMLVRHWTPTHTGLGTAVYTNGLLTGVASSSAATIPLVLPLVGNSWRWSMVFWAIPVLLTAFLVFACAPRGEPRTRAQTAAQNRWWPDWKSPVTWLLGLAFGCNNAMYYSANAFLPDWLAHVGRPDLIGAALGFCNGAQLFASFLLLGFADRLQRRAWPFLVFGPMTLLGFIGIMTGDGIFLVIAATMVGFATAISFVSLLALPPVLSPPDDVHRLAAGMFTISYSFGVIIPVLSGGLWDLTGQPWTVFVLPCLCALLLTTLGFKLSRYRPAAG
ncbi:MAG: major facilitator superfamily protein [Xanthobacteraceae bacterium]|nr:major facilitator superfamily protein [Xanthobacteraceae bacterium]